MVFVTSVPVDEMFELMLGPLGEGLPHADADVMPRVASGGYASST